MKKNIFIIPILFSYTLSAQTVSDFQKQQQAEMQKMQQEQSSEKKKIKKDYADYVRERDAEWAVYLTEEWQQFQAFSGKKVPIKPKPKVIPKYTPTSKLPVPKVVPFKIAPKPVVVLPIPIPKDVEPIRKPAVEETNPSETQFDFYGRSFTMIFDSSIQKINVTAINQDIISQFWKKMSSSNYSALVEKLLQAKSELQLNDYGYFQLVQQCSKSIFSANENTQNLLTWFIMVRTGYGIKVGYNNNKILLLLPIEQQVYNKQYLTINNKLYYIFPKNNDGLIYTYDKDYSSYTRLVDLNLTTPINFTRKTEKTFTFSFENRTYSINVAYNPELINFYNAYLNAEFSVYFKAVASKQAKESLLAALKPYTSQMDEWKAVNFLLRFVQTAFSYKTDQEQFNREKYFFVDELFHYPYSDCEDRSVLFAYLVRELIGLQVIGLNYPEHMATAVAFSKEIKGDYLKYKNKKYVIADPTYINAPVGLSMPQYRAVSPIVIDF